ISHFPELEKSAARGKIEQQLTAAFQQIYADLRHKFQLTTDDLPHPPRERMRRTSKQSRQIFRRAAASTVDFAMCASMNLLQSRHRLKGNSLQEMERYVAECEKLTPHEYYAVPKDVELVRALAARPMNHQSSRVANAIRDSRITSVRWRSPIETAFERNNTARIDFFPCARGQNAPTVFMLHALMSATHIGYRRWA